MLVWFQWQGIGFQFNSTSVMENGGAWRFAQEIFTDAPPGCSSGGGSTTKR